MTAETNLRIEESEGRFYLYDTMESGRCICYGVFDDEKSAKKELKRYIEVETAQKRSKAA